MWALAGPPKYVEQWPLGSFIGFLRNYFTYFWGSGMCFSSQGRARHDTALDNTASRFSNAKVRASQS